MDFTVTFNTAAVYRYAVDVGQKPTGLRHLDQARGATTSGLPARLVSSALYSVRRNPAIKISEAQARQAGQVFWDANAVKVVVPAASLNEFLKEKMELLRRDEDDGIILVKFRWELDEEAVVNTWIAAGAPLEWDPASA